MMNQQGGQVRLLADYCDALARDRQAKAPDQLDPQLLALAQHVAGQAVPEPDASTLAAIRARVLSDAAPATDQATWLRRAQLATVRIFAPPHFDQRESRRPSPTNRIAGVLLATLIAVVAIGALILSLTTLRPQQGQGGVPTSTRPIPAIACGFPPTTVRPTVMPRNPTDTAHTATIGVQLTATATVQPVSTAITSARGGDPCTMFPGENLLSIDQAAAIVRALIDDPTAALYASYGTAAATNTPSIVIERPFSAEAGLIATADHFELDATTGTLISFSMASRESLSLPENAIDDDTATKRAEVFAREQFRGLDRLERRSIQQFEGIYGKTEVVWQLRDGSSGAWLPTSIRVTVSRRTGLVMAYWRVERTYVGPTQPQIDETAARERVLVLARQDPRYTNATVAQTTLWVATPKQVNNENADFRLVWTITLANVPQAPGEYLTPTWYVDAITGEVIPGKGIG